MTRRRALRLALIGVAATLVVVLVVGAALVGALIHRPLPDRSGTVSLSNLDGTVTVMRDGLGVPQVYADTTDDLFRAQGYVQAQDRFFEMDLRRHITAGRLSELVGANPDALQADEVIRTMGWREVAARELPLLSPTIRGYLEAYARGVNDYLSTRSASELSVSYTILGLGHPLRQIEPWTPLDSLTWLKAMAWDLRGNYTQELDRARIVASVKDPARVEQLYPAYPYAEHSPIIPSATTSGLAAPHPASPTARHASPAAGPPAGALAGADVQAALASAARAVAAVPAMLGGSGSGSGSGSGAGVGSNSWVVSGALTASGKPLLANDPHQSISIPGIWYQMGLHCRRLTPACPFDVAGYTFSGLPGVVVGHNARIAWGLTNLGPDVTDFYLEKLHGDRALRDGKEVPLTTRQEVIRVAGAASVRITVRSSVHGPLLSDVVDDVRDVGRSAPVARGAPQRGPGYAVALAWTALTPGRTMEAIFGIDAARDFAEFRAGALKLEVPAQNLVYADVDGHIGYQAPGRIPIRSTARGSWPVPTDGTWPLPGWDSAFDWQGYVPTSRLPWVFDPPDGFIVTANQPVTAPGSPVFFTSDWDYGFRSQRIRDLLTEARDSGHRLGIADMRAIQADTRNGMAAQLVPLLLKVKVDAFTRQAQDLLRHWDFRQPDDSAPAAYFNAVWATLLRLTFDDELPEGSRPDGGDRWFQVVRTLLAHPHDPWWDDRTTADVVETRDEVIRQALVQARLELTSRLGKEPSEWEWGRLHRLTLVQQPLGAAGVPTLVHLLVNRGPYDLQGGSAIVDAFAWDAASGSFAVTAGPSMRMIVDLSNMDGSRWVNETGSSGHPADAHYADQVNAWLSVHDYPWAFTEPAVRAATRETLTLAPAGG